MAKTYRITNTNKGGLTNQHIARTAGGGRNAHKVRKEMGMETEAMYGGRDAACTMPRTSDRTSCGMPGSVWKSLLAGAIHPDDIAYRTDSTGSDMDEYLRRLTTRFFGESVWELHNIIKEDYKT